MSASYSRSPPPLQHPIPTHPANPYNLPSSPPPPSESSVTSSSNYANQQYPSSASSNKLSGAGGSNYQRFSSPSAERLQNGLGGGGGGGGGPGGGGVYDYSPQAVGRIGGGGGYGGAPGQPGGAQSQEGPWGTMGGANGMNAWGVNDATAQMGMQFGRSAMVAGTEYMEKNFVRHLPVTHLKHSFNVSNTYVLHKLRLVLFPWRHKPWSRLVKRSEANGQAEGYRPPREDVNSPDLYIPAMALVTYILLSGVVAGSKGAFHPELLGLTASKSLGIVVLEFLAIKLGCYLLNITGDGTMVDLVAYSGYKFVGIIVTLLAGLLQFRGWVYWGIFAYTFCANAFFLLRSLRYVVLPDPAMAFSANSTSTANPVTHAQRSRRVQFLFGIAVSQILSMLLLMRF